jgi:hypothetical protein
VVEAGAGMMMDKWHLEVSEISRNVLSLVRNTTYRAAAKKLGRILRQSGGVARAADVVQDTMQRVKYDLLRQPEQLQCWHQVYQLDLLALLGAFLLLAMLLVRAVFLCLLTAMAKLRPKKAHDATNSTADESAAPVEQPLAWKDVRSIGTAATFVQQLFSASSSSPPPPPPASKSILLNGHRSSFPLSVVPPPSHAGSGDLASSSDASSASVNERIRSDSVDSMDSNGSSGAQEEETQQQMRQRHSFDAGSK